MKKIIGVLAIAGLAFGLWAEESPKDRTNRPEESQFDMKHEAHEQPFTDRTIRMETALKDLSKYTDRSFDL